ncbi:MAG: hypothetical protein QOJ52_2826 [Acidimicrobiaceae bacterium]|nr:hypothetical protein [Acidimicrobiaceae bacterium]
MVDRAEGRDSRDSRASSGRPDAVDALTPSTERPAATQPARAMIAWAAASRAMGTRNGEQDT